MATLLALLTKGYFPRELPPPFNTRSFGAYAVVNARNWPKSQWTRCARHNLARPGGLRRPLGIPNPAAYFRLADIVAANWTALKSHTWKHRLSASRPHPMTKSPRAVVPRYRYGELPRLRALRRRAARYLLLTDIAQFYPTMYTHAIPWALHGKTAAKQALASKNKGAHLLGNKIDKALQYMSDGQTHGIPIGPDTSLMVAEVLLAAADEILLTRCQGMVRGFRYVDDYELSFPTLREAEQVLTEIQGILAEFELVLNPRKTGVVELPQSIDGRWASDISRFSVRDATHPVGQRNDLLSLFSMAFDTARGAPEESVLKFAVARVQNVAVDAAGWRTFQNCVLGCATADSSTVASVLGTIHKVSQAGNHQVSKVPLAEVCESIILRHAPRGQGSEVAWALWAAVSWGLTLSPSTAQAVCRMDDDVVALLALCADARGVWLAGSLDKQAWAILAGQPGALTSEHWLLAYEAHRQGWIVVPATAQDPMFGPMLNAGVSFFDSTLCTPLFPDAALGLPGGALPDYYA
jgi:hypothetical protein